MFKSIFAKYVSAFMLMLLCTFLIIILLISSIVGNYSETAKAEMMNTAAHSSAEYIEKKLDPSVSLSSLLETNGEDVDTVLCLGDTVIAALKLKKDQIYKI